MSVDTKYPLFKTGRGRRSETEQMPLHAELLVNKAPVVRSAYAVPVTEDGEPQQDGGAVVLAVRPLWDDGLYTRVSDVETLIRDEDELDRITEGFEAACNKLILPLLTTEFLEEKGSVEMMYFPRGMRKDMLDGDQSIGGFCVKVNRIVTDKTLRVTLTTTRRFAEEGEADPMSEAPWEVAVERPVKRRRMAGSALRETLVKCV